MDFGRVLGAMLNGAGSPPQRRRRTNSPLGLTQAESRQLGHVLGALAGIAAEALTKPHTPEPILPRPVPASAKMPPPTPPRRIPEAGAPAPLPAAGAAEHAEARLLLRAMVAAAKADALLDAAERRSIATQLDAVALDAAERAAILAEFDHPASAEDLAREAQDPMLAAQIYAAAFAAAGDISPPERAWLDRLSAALKLDAAARATIETRLGG
jgi:uncharacterized membrane protein YebE (DUF533 family)